MTQQPPPVSDEWKPNHSTAQKKFGLIRYHRSMFSWRGSGPDGLYGYTTWHRSEQARTDAIENANKTTYVVAMMKVNR